MKLLALLVLLTRKIMANNPFEVVPSPSYATSYAAPLLDFSALSGQQPAQQQPNNSAQNWGQALAAFKPGSQSNSGGNVGGGGGGVGGWWTPERQQYAVDYLKNNAGLSDIGAQGLVTRWAAVEAGGGPGEVNPSSGAAGIGQWLGERKHGFALGDFDSQLRHAADELVGSERSAGDALRRARTKEDAAVGASMYERAEGYDWRTGRDAFVNKTLKNMNQ